MPYRPGQGDHGGAPTRGIEPSPPALSSGGGGGGLPCFQQMGTAELPASRAVTALQVEEIVHQNDVQFTHNSTEDVRQAALSEKTRR